MQVGRRAATALHVILRVDATVSLIDPDVSPGATTVHGVSNPSAITVCCSDVELWNAIVCPERMFAGSGFATTHVAFAVDGVRVTTTVAG